MIRARMTPFRWYVRAALTVLLMIPSMPALKAQAGSPAIDGTWSQPTLAVSPSRRRGATLLYDGTRHRALMFGGLNFNETWVLDLENPTSWELLPVDGSLPLAQGDCNAVFDPVNDRLWFFGGHHSSGATYDEAAYLQFTNTPGDTATWVHFNAQGEPGTGQRPQGRYGSGTTYDPMGQRMILFGGGFGNASLATGGTWALSLNAIPTWDLLPPGSPYSYGGKFSNLFIDPIRNRLVFHFCLESTGYWQWPIYPAPDIYTAPLDGSEGWTYLPQSNADSLQYSARESAYHPLQDRIISLQDTYLSTYWGFVGPPGTWDFSFQTGTWRHLDPLNGPGPSTADEIVYDPENDRMVVIRYPDPGTVMETWFLTWTGTSGVTEAPAPLSLLTAGVPRPNPSSAGVVIPLELREASVLEALIVDSQGRRVRGIQPASYAPGRAELTWDGRSDRGEAVNAGVYFVRISISDGRVSRVVRVVRAG